MTASAQLKIEAAGNFGGLGIFFSYEHGFLDLSQVSGYRAFTNLANLGLYFKFGRKK